MVQALAENPENKIILGSSQDERKNDVLSHKFEKIYWNSQEQLEKICTGKIDLTKPNKCLRIFMHHMHYLATFIKDLF